MGTNMPSNDNAALVWLEGHIDQWVASAATIGLTDGQTSDLAAKITDTRTTFTSVEQIRSDSKAQTVAYHSKAVGMRDTASDMIADIKSFANTASDPNAVYTTAGITPADRIAGRRRLGHHQLRRTRGGRDRLGDQPQARGRDQLHAPRPRRRGDQVVHRHHRDRRRRHRDVPDPRYPRLAHRPSQLPAHRPVRLGRRRPR